MKDFELLSQSNIYKHMPLYISWKDTSLTYLGANDYFVKSVGLNSVFEIIGKKDRELPWAEDAPELEKTAQLVLQGQSFLNVRGLRWHPEGHRMLILYTVPLKDDTGRIIGILSMHQNLADEIVDLQPQKNEAIVVPTMRKELLAYLKKTLNDELTSREIECLSLWLGGYSIKESSYCLGLSHKSIEAYRSNIKDKLKVHHRFQVIELMQSKATFELCLSLAKLIQENVKNPIPAPEVDD